MRRLNHAGHGIAFSSLPGIAGGLRYLINKNKFVSDDLVRRVNAAVQELEYIANPIAQKMKFKHTKTIGVIMSDLRGLFFPYIIKGMYDMLNPKGYRLIIVDSEGNRDSMGSVKKLREGIRGLIQDRVDGIVFASTLPKEMEANIIYDMLKHSSLKRHTALVCVDNDLSRYGIASVFSNSVTGAGMAVSHLINVGCKNIGHITGPAFLSVVQDRITAYKNVMEHNGLSVDDNRMISAGDYTHKSGYLAMKELLRKMSGIDGVFVANDQMSVGALKALSEAGRRVPDEIKVIGYDDVFIASVLEPSLSTIHIEKYAMGEKAAELLLEQIGNGENHLAGTSVELESKLVIRKSTVKNAPNDWILVDW